MNWHIVTASKGGVGKTLTTMLLLTYYLEEDEGVLVIDLNAMNTDMSSMLLASSGNVHKPVGFLLQRSKRTIWVKRTSSLNVPFLVAWPADPFLLYDRTGFAELLVEIKQHQPQFESILNKPLKHVIIDTNYHFCNLFPKNYDDYDIPEWKSLIEDDLTIWFIWVYRQLKKILETTISEIDEIEIVRQTAFTIERIFNKSVLGPLMHTYTPVGLLPTDIDESNILLKWFSKGLSLDRDYTISHLKKLAYSEKKGSYVSFTPWMEALENAHKKIDGKIDEHLLFGKAVFEAAQNISWDETSLPINLFPFSLYEATLMGYTDKKRKDAIANLKELNTYKFFKMLLRRKFGDI